jgi:hypothetical protein
LLVPSFQLMTQTSVCPKCSSPLLSNRTCSNRDCRWDGTARSAAVRQEFASYAEYLAYIYGRGWASKIAKARSEAVGRQQTIQELMEAAP